MSSESTGKKPPQIPIIPNHVRRLNRKTGRMEAVKLYGYGFDTYFPDRWAIKQGLYMDANTPSRMSNAIRDMERQFPDDLVVTFESVKSREKEDQILYCFVVGSNRNYDEYRMYKEFNEEQSRCMCEVMQIPYDEPKWYYWLSDR